MNLCSFLNNKLGSLLILIFQLATNSAFSEEVVSQGGHNNKHANVLMQKQVREGFRSNDPWLGLVGDSGITGAVTSRSLAPNLSSLLSTVFTFALESRRAGQIAEISRIPYASEFGLKNKADPLIRVLYSTREFYERKVEGKEATLNLEAKASVRLDIPEYSFGYLVGRGLGFPADRIVLVGQNGKQVTSIFEQMERFSEVSETLPSLVLVSYSANDICGDEFDQSESQFQENFRTKVIQQLDQVVLKLKPHMLGTHVIVAAPLDVAQLLANPSLQEQKVQFQGNRDATCGDLRRQTAARGDLGVKLSATLHGMCRSILTIDPSDQSKLKRLKDRQLLQIRIWEEVLTRYQNLKGWRFDFTSSVRSPRFENGDLANDCFHPGPGAHSRIARELLKWFDSENSNYPTQPLKISAPLDRN